MRRVLRASPRARIPPGLGPEMKPRGGGRGDRHRRGSAALLLLLLATSAWLYGALLVLYPKVFRRRYSEEMRRDFRELMLEGLAEGGAKELVIVLAQAFSDLVLTALKERSTLLAARSAYSLSVDPRIAVRAMVAVVLVAVAVTGASFLQTPTYEASANVLVAQKQGLTLMSTYAIDSRPVAEKAIGRLGLQMEPAELLDNLTVEQVEDTSYTSFIVLTYEDTVPERAQRIANTVSEVSSEFSSERSSTFRDTVWEKAALPESPVSPHPLRNGLLTLVIGLMLCAGLALGLPVVAASVAGKLGRQAVLQGVGQAGIPAVVRAGPSQAEGIREKELLQALGRAPNGKLTVAGAALETSLSVEEAERILSKLAVRGHLEVTVANGRLHYALWDRDAHL
jgi:capsular polysaccharide biosynthesis protein